MDGARAASGAGVALAIRSQAARLRPLALYAALTLLLTFPLWIHPARTVLGHHPDTELFVWILAWDAHAFVHQPFAIFDANIYHPLRLTLAYSENLIGSAFVAAPIIWLTGEPVLAMNLVALLSCILCGLGAYVLARRVGVSPGGAALCGLIFAFAPPRFLRLGQMHLTAVQWVPFGLAFLHAYLEGGRPRDLRLAAGFFSLQALTSGHGAVFLGVAMALLVAYRVLLGARPLSTVVLRDFGITGALVAAPAALVLLPYWRVQSEAGLTRALESWETPAQNFIASPTHVHKLALSWISDAPINDSATAFLFPGYLPLLLGAVALASGLISRQRRVAPAEPSAVGHRGTVWTRAATILEVGALASAIVAAVTSFGPVRVKWGGAVLFSAGGPARAILVGGILVAMRIALVRRVPFDLPGRLRRGRRAWRRWGESWRRDMTTFYAVLTIGSVLLSAGPPFGLWPVVYRLPGFSFIRVPSRFMILGVLGLAVLAAMGVDRLLARVRPAWRLALTIAVGACLVAEFAIIPLTVVPYRLQIPAVDGWLASRPKPFVVAEVPVWPSERVQTRYMLHSTAHWQKTVHGYSGTRLRLHEDLYSMLRIFPDPRVLRKLQDFGVDYIVVHGEMYPPGEWAGVDLRLNEVSRLLTLVHADGLDRVYALARRPE